MKKMNMKKTKTKNFLINFQGNILNFEIRKNNY